MSKRPHPGGNIKNPLATRKKKRAWGRLLVGKEEERKKGNLLQRKVTPK